MLVLAPAFFGLFVQAWKVKRVVFDYKHDTSSNTTTTTSSSSSSNKRENPNSQAHATTDISVYDRISGAYLGTTFYPIVAGGALYTLLCRHHSGWYDWIITSSVGAVYTLGFVAMTPQLFVNYQLKSVAHLPWRVLVYRALNTFIDDLFALIIPMPTLHRIACLRDDVVFFVLLYQRWIYPHKKRA